MADGDAITGDYQAEARGLLLGDTTSYNFISFADLDKRIVNHSLHGFAHGDGGYAGQDLLAPVEFTLAVEIEAATPALVGAAKVALSAAWKRGVDINLVYQLPGEVKKRRVGRCGAFLPNIDTTQYGLVECGLQFFADDPLKYANAETSQAYAVGATTAVTNSGDEQTWWTWTVTGPATGPKLIHNGLSEVIDFDGLVIGGGSTLVVNSKTHTALVDGSTNVYGSLTPISDWFPISPGSNSLTYTTDAGAGGSTVAWRSAWG